MKSGKTLSEKNRRITMTALLCAAALALSFAESALPSAAFMLPGSKPGLSNTAVMFAALSLGWAQTFMIVAAKAVFALITRGAAAALMSLCGGVLSALCMLLLFKKAKGVGCIGTGVLSALCHNAGQLAAAAALMKSGAVAGYAPVLVLVSVVTGIVTGSVLKAALPYFSKIIKAKEMEK